jgi:hypothetical protein
VVQIDAESEEENSLESKSEDYLYRCKIMREVVMSGTQFECFYHEEVEHVSWAN